MSDDLSEPNLHLSLSPIVIHSPIYDSEWKLEVNENMHAFRPHPQMECDICGESKKGEIRIDGVVKTNGGTKIPVWGYINYKPDYAECHCNGDVYDNMREDIELRVRNAWHACPEDYTDIVELDDGEFFMTLVTTVCDQDARKLYPILLGKEDINYYEC